MSSRRIFRFLAGIALLISSAAVAPAIAAMQQDFSFDSNRLEVRNLIGEIRLEPHSGSGYEAQVRIAGKDAADGMVEVEATGDRLTVRFPSDVTDYVYPPMGNSNSSFKVGGGDGWMSELLGAVLGSGRIRVSGKGSGTELWVDVTIRVPRGADIEVKHGVGNMIAGAVDGDLDLSTRTGAIELDGARGEIDVSTGSGKVVARRISGSDANIGTGSGDVTAVDCDSDRLKIGTGSGDVQIDGLRGRSVQIGTGSGDVEASRTEADRLQIGTGSGDVDLQLDRVGDGKFSVGTGSGDISLELPAGVSAEVHAETSGGRIRVDLEGRVEFSKQDDDEVRFTIGGGAAKVDLGTGSGTIRIF